MQKVLTRIVAICWLLAFLVMCPVAPSQGKIFKPKAQTAKASKPAKTEKETPSVEAWTLHQAPTAAQAEVQFDALIFEPLQPLVWLIPVAAKAVWPSDYLVSNPEAILRGSFSARAP